MRVLATGGAGYVGSHCVRALRRAGHEVVLLDDLSRGHRAFVERLGVPLGQADLRDKGAVERAVSGGAGGGAGGGFDAVLHFAAFALVPESVERPRLYWEINF